MTPSNAPNFANLVFDPTVYGLSIFIVAAALYAAAVSLGVRRAARDPVRRRMAVGTCLAAVGFATIIGTAISLLALYRAGSVGGLLYLQVQFAVVYVGCASIFVGVDRMALSSWGPTLRRLLWIAFLASVVIASAFLLDPATYTVTDVGGATRVAQEGVFWLPPFATLIIGAIVVSVSARGRAEALTRAPAFWLAVFMASEVIGILKESNLVPSSGDPFADMLLAFVPFEVGSLSLALGANSLRSEGGTVVATRN